MIDLADSRNSEAAKRFGADISVNNGTTDAVAAIMELTGGLGVDVAIEAVGVPATFESWLHASSCVPEVTSPTSVSTASRRRCTSSSSGRGIVTISDVGLVDTYSTPMLLRLVASGQLDAKPFITHHYPFEQFMDAYDTFKNAAESGALKIVLTRRGLACTLPRAARFKVGHRDPPEMGGSRPRAAADCVVAPHRLPANSPRTR